MQELRRRRAHFQKAPEKVESILKGIFKENSEISNRIEESRAITAWAEIVGEAAAHSSRALRIRSGVLIIQVSDSLWMQQLLLLKSGLIKRYRQIFPNLKLTDIYFTRY